MKVPFIRRRSRRWRLRIAAFIAGGEVHQYEGRSSSGNWVKGEIIATPEGMRALKAPFRTGAQVFSDTALTDPPK